MRRDRDHPESLSRMRLAYVQAMSRLRSEYVDTPAGYHDEEARSADQSRIEEAEQECFFMEGGVLRTPDIPADTFVGRNRELGEIHSRMRQGHRIILISGMGGIGKTALAAAYAARTEGAQDGYDAVLWLPAGDGLQQAVTGDAVLSVSGMSYSQRKYRSVKRYFHAKLAALARMMSKRRTLLIIDDIRKVRLQEMIPVLNLDCDILITSRLTAKNFGQLPNGLMPYQIALHGLTEEESETLAASLLPDITPGRMLEYGSVYRKLQGHTLALKLWLTSGGILSGTKAREIVGTPGNDLKIESRRLLVNLSLLPQEGVELSWAEKMCSAPAEQFRELAERSLLQVTSGDTERVSMHPLIAENIRKNMNPDMKKCRRFVENIASDVGNAWNLPREDMIKRLPAVRSVLMYLPETPAWLSDALDRIYTYLWVMEDYALSERCYLKLYKTILAACGENSQNTGWMALRVAAVYHNSLRFDEAERWYDRSLQILRRCVPKNADILWQRVEACGKCMRGPLFRGERKKVLELIREADELLRKPPEDARSDRFLLTEAYHSRRSAGIYLDFGDTEKAERCRRQMHLQMDSYLSRCGMEGLRDAQCCLDIRETDMEFALAAGNLPEAQRLLEENLEGYTLYRGAGHEDTLHCMEKLADVLLSFPEHSAERTGRAKDLYCRVAAGIHENYPFDVRWLGRVKEKMKGL